MSQPSEALRARWEFQRVMSWLKQWGYALVDSDGNPVALEQEMRLERFYAGEET